MNEISGKPNFKRIAFAMQNKDPEARKVSWANMPRETLPELDNKKLEELLEEYNLIEYLPDFIYMAEHFLDDYSVVKSAYNRGLETGRKKNELLHALKLMYDNPLNKIKINIKKNKGKIYSTTIQNEELLNIIRNALLLNCINADWNFRKGCINPGEIEDWGKYINIIFEMECHTIKRKGRRIKHLGIGYMITTIQRYLQEYTCVIAEQETSISRTQASFIYKFLLSLNLLQDDLAWREDNIRHILNKYRKARIKSKPSWQGTIESIKRSKEDKEKFQAKIKEISKKK